MKEKELRLALVCYGGVSLAVYEYGIITEVLSLVRASKAYHAAADAEAKQAPGHTFKAVAGADPEHCTEPVYFDLLQAIGGTLDLRVIVDVVAGASAGGINGIILARALAHDLSLEPLTEMWLAKADIQRLLAPEAKARMWSKWYFRPLIEPLLWRLGREGLIPNVPDLEMRAALSTFLRSRWFRPPLDGQGFTNLLLDGLQAMAEGRSGEGSLLPAGQRLDLIVTVTDFYGAARAIFLHDPPVVHEREHRRFLYFSFEHPPGGPVLSDFGADHLPSLAFAARATSSYPGAFPPAQIREIDAVVAARGQSWTGRTDFLESNFRHYTDPGRSPDQAVLLDGSVLNNKPLSAAIAAAKTHRAFREVDRRLVYIDPRPNRDSPRKPRTPGFFATLRGALSDLPRYEPIYDELLEIDAYNERVRLRRSVVEATRLQVSVLVEKITEGQLAEQVGPEDLRRWRLNAPGMLASTGLVYNGWMQLILGESAGFVADLISRICGYSDPPRSRWVENCIHVWASKVGIYSGDYTYPAVDREAELPPYGRFMANFGVKYRRRRLTFVIQAINRLYVRAAELDGCGPNPSLLDVLKRRLYRCLDALKIYDDTSFLSAELLAQVRALFGGLPEIAPGEAPPEAEAFEAEHEAEISALLERLTEACDLVGLNEEVDAVLASPTVFALGPQCQSELLVSYVGYLFWDIVVLPMTATRGAWEASALEEVLVDRISPEDATSLRLDGEGPILRGGSFAGFGGFFSRSTRENDYLWGRLHAIERLLDLTASTARREIAGAGIDVRAFKKRGFEHVLQREAARLPLAADLIGRLQTAVAQL